MRNRLITIPAKPAPIDIDPAKAAVIVVDMENDFASEHGLFDHAGVDISGAEAAIPSIQAALAAARRGDIRIIYLKMGFQPDLSDLGTEDSVNRVRHLRFGVGQSMEARRQNRSFPHPGHAEHGYRSRA